jgi:hypothetical protein
MKSAVIWDKSSRSSLKSADVSEQHVTSIFMVELQGQARRHRTADDTFSLAHGHTPQPHSRTQQELEKSPKAFSAASTYRRRRGMWTDDRRPIDAVHVSVDMYILRRLASSLNLVPVVASVRDLTRPREADAFEASTFWATSWLQRRTPRRPWAGCISRRNPSRCVAGVTGQEPGVVHRVTFAESSCSISSFSLIQASRSRRCGACGQFCPAERPAAAWTGHRDQSYPETGC